MAETVLLIDDDQADLDMTNEAMNEFDPSIQAISYRNPREASIQSRVK